MNNKALDEIGAFTMIINENSVYLVWSGVGRFRRRTETPDPIPSITTEKKTFFLCILENFQFLGDDRCTYRKPSSNFGVNLMIF